MQYDRLYQDLVHGAQIIRALFQGLSQDEAQVKPDPDSWSALEVLCHLYDEEREDFRFHLDSILHRPGEVWPSFDPQAWVSERAYNQRDLAGMLSAFLAEREQSLQWLQGLSAPDWDAAHSEPWGTLTAGDMFSAWVDHDNLHIRQLVELRQARLVRQAEPYGVRYAGEW
jgi:hypothetical protein